MRNRMLGKPKREDLEASFSETLRDAFVQISEPATPTNASGLRSTNMRR